MADPVTRSNPSKKSKKRKRTIHDEGPDRGFRLLRYEMMIPLGPVHSGDVLAGVSEILDSLVTRYIPSLGVVLCTINHETLQLASTASLITPTAIAGVPVIFECLGWRPRIGTTLTARLVTHTREHISLLVHNAFNAKISAQHIPREEYTFNPDQLAPVYENDAFAQVFQEMEAEIAEKRRSEEARAQIEDLELVSNIDEAQQKERAMSVAASTTAEGHVGCWVHNESGQPLGGESGQIEFKVIGLTMLNATISVHGSLPSNPFDADTSLPALPAIPASVRAPPASQPLGNKPLDLPTPSDSEISDYNDEELNRPAVPLLSPPASAKAKGKQRQQPEDTQADDVLMQADKDDTVLQDPEQLPSSVNLAGQDVPVVKEKKKKKRKASPPAAGQMEVDLDNVQPPKKKRRSEVKDGGMDVDEPVEGKKSKKQKKQRPAEEESAAITLPTLNGKKDKKAKSEKKVKKKAQ